MAVNLKAVGELLDTVPRQAKIKRSAYQESGKYPIVDQSQADIAGYTDDQSFLYKGELPVVIFGDHTRVLKFVGFPFCVGADGTQLLRPVAGNDIRYFFYALRNIGLASYGYERHFKYLKEKEIPAPPLPIQRRIADILFAYDELIENSQRRIKILESIARATYREWFVHLRFPGHESVPCIPSPLGEIPLGWEVRKLLELTKVNYGKNLASKKLTDDGTYPVYGASKIIGRYTEYNREQRTIICGCRGSVGELQITQPRCYVTNNSFTFDPLQPDSYFWLFQTLKERGLRDVIGGAAQPQITLESISSVEIATPPLPLRTRFQQAVAQLYEQAWLLDSQIQNLRRARDLLIPRLISGQIDVEDTST